MIVCELANFGLTVENTMWQGLEQTLSTKLNGIHLKSPQNWMP